ncbi:MAG: DNA gyrase inhibitor YacG [Nannocystaceae bacterium]|nr:DNA gyrase inhibitor YacG [Nannocystaceae bacterium]
MQIQCPICHRADEVADDFAFRPFCSRRCKMIDLGNWLDGVYRVVVPGEAIDPSASGSHRALPLMLTPDE